MESWKNKQSEALFEAFTNLETANEAAKFCRDLMTENEIDELAGRWAVARELDKGTPQRQTSEKTGVSIATVTRVNKWLKRGKGGYRLVLDRFE
jgi:TrpR-related protein YerC/YecD